jgi:hypothetical protein
MGFTEKVIAWFPRTKISSLDRIELWIDLNPTVMSMQTDPPPTMDTGPCDMQWAPSIEVKKTSAPSPSSAHSGHKVTSSSSAAASSSTAAAIPTPKVSVSTSSAVGDILKALKAIPHEEITVLKEMFEGINKLSDEIIRLHCVNSVWRSRSCKCCKKTSKEASLSRCSECHLEFFCSPACQYQFRTHMHGKCARPQFRDLMRSCSNPCPVCCVISEFVQNWLLQSRLADHCPKHKFPQLKWSRGHGWVKVQPVPVFSETKNHTAAAAAAVPKS